MSGIQDFEEFYDAEYKFAKAVYGKSTTLWKFYLKLDLIDSRSIPFLIYCRNFIFKIHKRLIQVIDISKNS